MESSDERLVILHVHVELKIKFFTCFPNNKQTVQEIL